MWFPVELPMPSDHFATRAPTPQSTTPVTKGVLLPVSWRTLDSRSSVTGTQNNNTVNITTYARVNKRDLGFAFSPSSGLWFAGFFREETNLTRNVPDSGNYRVSGLLEEFTLREGVVRTGFDVSSSLSLGLGLRGQLVKADVAGSFGVATDDRTLYAGQRMGLAAAAVYSQQSLKLAVRYDSPVTGKLTVAGEGKLSSTPGYLGAAVNFAVSPDLSFRGQSGTFEFAKNDLGTAIVSSSRTRQTSVIPMGVAVDVRFVPLSVMGFGVQSRFGSVARVDADLVYGKIYEATEPQMMPPSKIEDSDKASMYAARLGLAIDKSDFETQLFIDYSTAKTTRTTTQSKLDYAIRQWGVGLRAGVEI